MRGAKHLSPHHAALMRGDARDGVGTAELLRFARAATPAKAAPYVLVKETVSRGRCYAADCPEPYLGEVFDPMAAGDPVVLAVTSSATYAAGTGRGTERSTSYIVTRYMRGAIGERWFGCEGAAGWNEKRARWTLYRATHAAKPRLAALAGQSFDSLDKIAAAITAAAKEKEAA